ncbi:MAG: DUF4115 domain-containing protein [Ignavibacteriae bacterium]|nr:DUF4115 domain-containing protein [Ignavibacteria bacterium]MBI3365330.1 DUF4115 domain-containing protein [Ignavibacteriota bacterium]
MSTVGAILRQAREGKGLSLDEIAQATRINRGALENLENDIPLKLPPTYIKAFIKSYARQVGLDPEEVLRVSEPQSSPTSEVNISSLHSSEQERIPQEQPRASAVSGTTQGKRRQIQGLIFLLGLTVVGLVVSLFWLQRERSTENVQEISFPEMMKERERGQLSSSVPTADSVQRVPYAVSKEDVIDSLVLEGVAVESTWVRLRADSATVHEYTVPPQLRMKWKAANSFSLTVGNGGGMYFTLNGVRLGTFGQGNRPVKDIVLTREMLKKTEQSNKQMKKKER